MQSSLALVDLFGCVWVVGWKQVQGGSMSIIQGSIFYILPLPPRGEGGKYGQKS